MQTTLPTPVTFSGGRHLRPGTAVIGLLLVLTFAQTVLAQTPPPLGFGNNFFVTGDYVVGGVGLRGLGVNGMATGDITIPDPNQPNASSVPPGAQIVAAILYWESVESSQTAFVGQKGFFRPVFPGGPSTGYPITGAVLGNPNAPISWSSGGCSGSSQGSKTMRVYRADVRPFLPVDSNGNVLANGTYEVSLADSGSNGGGTPFTLGATLVLIYRVLSPNFPLNSIMIYDGAFAPSNGASTMTQTMQGFYQAAASPVAKLTHIVGNGQSNKFESVSFSGVNLPSLYAGLPPFPGIYNGSWDNPTWVVNNYPPVGTAVKANDFQETTSVVPSASNSGCVSWGAVILSTTVQNSDNDGILDVWKQQNPPGYCDAAINGGVCNVGDTTDPGWVPLPGAAKGHKDLFVQIDYLCSNATSNTSCDTTNGGYSFYPPANALTMMAGAFASKSIVLHAIPGYAIQESTCTDSTDSSGNPILCPYPNQPGVVGWKGGFELLKNQPLNYSTESDCEAATNPPCIRRFQHGKKDSYHYAIFGHALGAANWTFLGGVLQSVQASGNTATFTTSAPHGLVAGTDRVSVANAFTNPSLNGTFIVQSTPAANSFTIQTATSTTGTVSYTRSTDPQLSVSSGKAGTGSGMSDVGGQDSLITLGLWGPDGQTVNANAGTFMHELGHTLALTHGGFYYDQPGSYVPTIEGNCKSNFQSVMNYLFQVDLLQNAAGQQVLDYSEQQLIPLNENTIGGISGLTDPNGNPTTYTTTAWYTPTQPVVGTAAKTHCDGSPLSPNDVQSPMYRVGGLTNPISPAWTNPQDINFSGGYDASWRGYGDWSHLDLRQIGATGADVIGSGGWAQGSGGWAQGSGGWAQGSGGWAQGSGGWAQGSGGWAQGSGGWAQGSGGVGHGELTREAANSVTRPPRQLSATVLSSPTRIQLNWVVPTFGQIGAYRIYRGVDGATPAPPAYATVTGTPPPTTFTDSRVSCGHTYMYFVTAVLAGTSQESVPSNSVTVAKCVVVQ